MEISGQPVQDQQVRELRHSSRLLVRSLGVMQPRVDVAGCSPTQCHALLELSVQGRLTAAELAARIDLDKSTVSRALGPLLEGGLIVVGPDSSDQRTKPIALTDAGRERVARIHAMADAHVRAALNLLDEEERRVVLSGITLYDRALRRAKALMGIEVGPIEARDEQGMARVIRTVMNEFRATGPGSSIGDAEVDNMHGAYRGSRHAYFVARRGNDPIAGAGFGPLEGRDADDVCELRKMFALPSARGLGIGRRLLELCLTGAREAGFRTCYLETLQHMHRARALYEKAGFRPIAMPMGHTGHYACDRWYVKELEASTKDVRVEAEPSSSPEPSPKTP